MRRVTILAASLAALFTTAPASAQTNAAPEPPPFVIFGAGAHSKEGDPDHLMSFYFSVPAGYDKPLYLRVFDPDTDGKYDQIASPGPDTTTRFTIFGGKGADTSAFARAETVGFQERSGGRVLLRQSYKFEPEYDGAWVTVGPVSPADGELVNGRLVFRLLIEGLSGNDGNSFDFAISSSPFQNVTPEGLQLVTYGATTRTPIEDVFTELRFRIPEDAKSINIGSFDAADADMFLTQPFRSRPLEPSGQNNWKTTKIEVEEADRGSPAAITLSGGTELPNDASYYVTDQAGKPIPIELPIRTLRPNPRPVAVAASQDLDCMMVRFDGSQSSDPQKEPLTYRWRLGDGQIATGVQATHTYNVEGRMTAWLEVFDSSPQVGNGATVSFPVFVKLPPVARSVSRKLVAANEDVTFDGSPSTASKWNIARHIWRVSDGKTIEGAVVTHSFRNPGTYRVTHIVEDDAGHRCNSASEEFEIRVNAPPVAAAGPDQLVTASVVQFDGSASSDSDGDSVIRYDWNFGEGSTGTGAKPSHVYAKPGTYTVQLTVTDSAGTLRNTGSNTMRVVVNARPIADAGPELVGAPGQTLTFDASRSVDPDGSIAEYLWDFRDGTTATGKTVSHAFAKPGIYNVRLRVKDNTGHEEAIDFDDVQVFVNTPPVAQAGPDVIAAPGDEIKLSAGRSSDSDGKINAYRWDIGDATEPLSGSDVSRRFDKPGIYTAKLTITDDSGAINATSSSELRIAINHAPAAAAGEDVQTNETTISFDGGKSVDADGDPLTYSWDFGDGSKATGVRVTHTYKEGGSYPVVLVVDDGKGLHNSTSQDAIAVRIDRAPVAVAGDNQNACTGDTIVLDGGKSRDPEGGVLRYLWDFGDGTKAEIVNPTKSYRQGGLYPVTLTVRDDSGMPQNFHTGRLAVRVDQGPVATALPREILACANTEVSFDGSKSTDIDGVVNSYRWDFGDGNFGGGERPTHIYEKPGRYRAFLTIQGEKAGNCSATSTDEIPVQIIAGPVAVIKAPASVPVNDAINFDGSASQVSDGKITGWRWDFGDGNSASGPQASHRYAKAGVYRVTLTIMNDSAQPTCRAVSSRQLVTVNAAPVARAEAKQLAATDEEIVFDATASSDPDGAIVNYEWDFGDGNKASGVVARHKYREPGAYKVKLAVHDNAALPNSIVTNELTVKVNSPPAPAISGPDVACVGEQITWASNGSTDADGPIRDFRWTFGDGTDAASAAGTHQYRKPGRFSLTLYADDGAQLSNSRRHVTKPVWVNVPPQSTPGPDRIVCPAEPVRFDGSASSDIDGKLTGYRWDFGDGNTKDGAQVEHHFLKPGTYQVKLTVTDDSKSTCSTHTSAIKVLVKAPPLARAGGDREVWVGGANDAILLDGSQSRDPDGHSLNYAWQIGDGSSTAGERVRHVIPAAGDYRATLTVSDTSGLSCGTATDSFRIIARERK